MFHVITPETITSLVVRVVPAALHTDWGHVRSHHVISYPHLRSAPTLTKTTFCRNSPAMALTVSVKAGSSVSPSAVPRCPRQNLSPTPPLPPAPRACRRPCHGRHTEAGVGAWRGTLTEGWIALLRLGAAQHLGTKQRAPRNHSQLFYIL